MKNTKVIHFTSALLLTTFLTACGAAGRPAQYLAATSIDNLGCKASQSEMWNTLHRIAEEGGAYPGAEELRRALLSEGSKRQLQGEAFGNYVEAFVAAYTVAIEGIQQKLNPKDLPTWKKALAELEVGVRVTSIHAELQDKLQPSLEKLEERDRQLNKQCNPPESPIVNVPSPVTPAPAAPAPEPSKSGTIWEKLLASENPEVYGARKTFATAYQSCDVLSLPAMTTATPSVEGITVLPDRHPAGGMKRVIGSVAKVNATHYYIKNQRLAKNSCFEVRNSPLIYDFGGKPGTSSSQPHILDMFRNSGSGTEVLGIDCSAYVFSALALAGLKMDPDPKKILKADLVHGIGSRAFKEPQANGLRCLAKITVGKNASIEAGDVAAINGHVVMIDEVGADPFGINKITSAADCVAAKLPFVNFDFVIAQSSPSKGGIGINRYQARDYLKESTTYRDGLTRYAVAACRAKFGLSATVDTTSLSVVRHKKTGECKASALVANKEECVDSCRPI